MAVVENGETFAEVCCPQLDVVVHTVLQNETNNTGKSDASNKEADAVAEEEESEEDESEDESELSASEEDEDTTWCRQFAAPLCPLLCKLLL